MKYAVIILLSFVFGLFSCGSPQVDSRGSAHVVVEYEGQVVQETGAYYLSIHEFEARLNDKSINRHFIIFMHDSCSGCIKVKMQSKQEDGIVTLVCLTFLKDGYMSLQKDTESTLCQQ